MTDLFFYCCFWKLKSSPGESVETKLFAMCASKYLTDQLVWRKPEQNTAVQFSPNWLALLLPFLYSVHCFISSFFFLFKSFVFSTFFGLEKNLNKSNLYALELRSFMFLFNHPPSFISLLWQISLQKQLIKENTAALMPCLTKSNCTRSALIKV